MLAWAPAASWGDDAQLRGADHPGFGRVVMQIPGSWQYHVQREGDDVTISLSGAASLPAAAFPPDHPNAPRNFRSVLDQDGVLRLTLADGAFLRVSRLGDRLVIDALDPTSAPANKPADLVSKPPPAQKPPVAPPPPIAAAAPPAAPPAAPSPAPDNGPVQIAVVRTDMPSGVTGDAILVPFEDNVGAAAFSRGQMETIVFDEASPLDLAQIATDPVFGGSKVTLLQDATVLRIPCPAKGDVRLMRVDAGWLVMIEDQGSVNSAIEPMGRDGDLFLPAATASRSIDIPDDMTGENLLIGTVRNPGQGVLADREAPEYRIMASDMGVAIEPISDRLHLLAEKDGFQLGVSGGGPDLTLPAASVPRMADAVHLSRHYDFPDLGTADLFREMQSEVVAAALSPPLSRFEPRYQVAQTMVALGLDAEAEAVMDLAITGDASQADNPDARGLQAIAATLAGRFDETAGLDDPRLDGWDDVKLWRAARNAMRDAAADAMPDAAHDPELAAEAAQFAAAAPLILTYPETLQSRLAPIAVETMALGGQLDAARALAATRPADPSLALGRAIIDEKLGNVDNALAGYDALDASTDRDARARAAERAVELRLATGKLSPAEAADALERQFLNWRGDGRELALRERAADLRVQAHDWRSALALLREAETVYPDDVPAIQDRMADTLSNMLRANGATALAPLDLVALADENADLIANSKQSEQLDGILADKLIALDLPERAAPVLQKLMKSAMPGVGQARLGAKLAEVQLDQDQPQAALDALASSVSDGLPDDVVTERAMSAARAQAALGKPDLAAQILMPIADPAADDLRAQIYENAKNWPGAEAALADLAAKSVPATGDLTDAQRDIEVRLASATAQAGDAARLKLLRLMIARMGVGDRADMFRLLVAEPVRGLSDLARARAEDGLANSIPGAIGSLH